ncbi:hypothetical protein E1264_24500 [Actinomadura sp. KC216]|uniref:hypothetical protein n=1 Tax=Actinomadura sp. KC216 TaxID=2530370 RepID=UPI00104C12AA|nr:hypothetical protein [Actinomadura sp. KC216]TDB84477.1 hypothetical protein E1264_24500 [Actinomadura sp. KC216]
MTSSNGRRTLLASQIPLDQISMPPGRSPRLVCADCKTWQPWKRGQVRAHPLWPGEAASPKCPGSHQRVFLDLTPDRLRELRAGAAAQARAIARSPREGYQQAPPVAPAVHQLAGRRSVPRLAVAR